MNKEYKNIKLLIEEFGFGEAVSYKFLELRNKSSLINKLFCELIIGHCNSSAYSRSYIAHWDTKGKLTYFNPNPSYPEDFRPINSKTFEPMPRLTDEEIKEKLPIEFAHTVSQIYKN